MNLIWPNLFEFGVRTIGYAMGTTGYAMGTTGYAMGTIEFVRVRLRHFVKRISVCILKKKRTESQP